jgi:hypothetical protein
VLITYILPSDRTVQTDEICRLVYTKAGEDRLYDGSLHRSRIFFVFSFLFMLSFLSCSFGGFVKSESGQVQMSYKGRRVEVEEELYGN